MQNQLDISKLEENYSEFRSYCSRIASIVKPEHFISVIRLAEALEISLEPDIRLDTMEKAIELIIMTQVIELTQFWLSNKDFFMSMDRILDHSENLPMKDLED